MWSAARCWLWPNDMKTELEKIIRHAGEIMLGAHDDLKVTSKPGTANFVTAYDLKVQAYLKEALTALLPEAAFVGEEDDVQREQSGLRWVVDPIDGTTNFMHGLGQSCISVALCEGSGTELGMIYQPYRDEVYFAEKNKRAFLNGEEIHVSSRPAEEGVILFGTMPYVRSLAPRTFAVARECFDFCADIRRSGCAAQDLTSVAAGRAEGYFELRLSPWDFSAGMLIAAEAGAWVTDVDGNPIDNRRPSSILCACPTVAEKMLTILKNNR